MRADGRVSARQRAQVGESREEGTWAGGRVDERVEMRLEVRVSQCSRASMRAVKGG